MKFSTCFGHKRDAGMGHKAAIANTSVCDVGDELIRLDIILTNITYMYMQFRISKG